MTFPWDKIDCELKNPDVFVSDFHLVAVGSDDSGMYESKNGRA